MPPNKNKFSRECLQGHVCNQCKAFYNALGLSEKQKKNLIQLCSRHRFEKGKKPPKEENNFWNLGFPNEKR